MRSVTKAAWISIVLIAASCSSDGEDGSDGEKGGSAGTSGGSGGAAAGSGPAGSGGVSGASGSGASGGGAGRGGAAGSGAGATGGSEGGAGGAQDGGEGGEATGGTSGAGAGAGGTSGAGPGGSGGRSGGGGGMTGGGVNGAGAGAGGTSGAMGGAGSAGAPGGMGGAGAGGAPGGKGGAGSGGAPGGAGGAGGGFGGPCDVNVPGDYAGVQQAITALRNSDTRATVCVANGTYTGDLAGTYGDAELTIAGASASGVILSGRLQVPDYAGTPALLRFRGVTITGGVTSSESVAFESCIVRGTGIAVTTPSSGQSITFAVERSDVSATNGTAIAVRHSAVNNTPREIATTLRNNYIHDSLTGLALSMSDYQVTYRSGGRLVALHNTFENDGVAIAITSTGISVPTTQFVGNLIIDSDVGVRSDRAVTMVTDDFRYNALYGNTTNYEGNAVPGTGYVTSNPLLVAGTPPAPGVGSPLINAASATLVPPTDFFGSARNGRPDIGAVRGP